MEHYTLACTDGMLLSDPDLIVVLFATQYKLLLRIQTFLCCPHIVSTPVSASYPPLGCCYLSLTLSKGTPGQGVFLSRNSLLQLQAYCDSDLLGNNLSLGILSCWPSHLFPSTPRNNLQFLDLLQKLCIMPWWLPLMSSPHLE